MERMMEAAESSAKKQIAEMKKKYKRQLEQKDKRIKTLEGQLNDERK